MHNRVIRRLWMTVTFSILLVSMGCGQKTPNYTPSLETSEDAIRQGLDAWKAGQPPGSVTGTKPLIHVTDAGRKPGQTLENYRILGEVQGSAGRSFAVTLQLANPTEEVKTRYIVIGIDPLMVFRQEDYDLLMHWDHFMPAETSAENDSTVTESSKSPGDDEKPIDPVVTVESSDES